MVRRGRVVRLNKKGFYEVRRAPKLHVLIDDITEQVAENCNEASGSDGYRTSSVQGAKRPFGRWRGTVITATQHAKNDNAKHDRLLKEINRVRRK